MPKKVNLKTVGNVPIKSRHLEWNVEKSPDRDDCLRYHFVAVDDKNRKKILMQILSQIQMVRSGIEVVRSVEGRVKDSKSRYLFESYDTPVAQREIDLSKISLPKIVNKELYERKKGSIEDYVAERFERD